MTEQTPTAEKDAGCTCPTGLGYRFHRHPCPRAGEIEPRVTPPGSGDAS